MNFMTSKHVIEEVETMVKPVDRNRRIRFLSLVARNGQLPQYVEI